MASFDIEDVLSKLTLEEKIGLIAGTDLWHTYPVPRLDIPALRVSDGPNGIRGTRFFNGIPGAVLPNGTGLAATFDKELIVRAGQLAAQEARHKSVHVDLGPTANMQRGPNGGRGFESFSEDPYVAGVMAAKMVQGLQSGHVAATMKHYVGNDLEHERNSSDSIVTQRAMREIYLEPFRLAVKYADPKAFMTGYNKVNGEHVSQSKKYLQEILRDEWKWDGTIMSDWWGTYTSKESIEAGLDLEMPGPRKMRAKDHLGHQIQSREVHINDLDDRVKGVLKLVKYAKESGIPENGPEGTGNNTPETSAFLRELAAETIVLLKNEGGVLPLKKEEKVAVIGPNAKFAAYSGGGSASLAAYYTVTPYEGISNKLGAAPEYTVGAYAHVSLPGLATQLKNPVTGQKGCKLIFYHEPRGTENRRKFDEFDNITSSTNLLFDYTHEEIEIGQVFYGDFEGIFTPDLTADYEFGMAVVGTSQLFIDDKLVIDNKTKQTGGGAIMGFGTREEKGTVHLEKGKEYNVRIEWGSAATHTLDRTGLDMLAYGGVTMGVARVLNDDEEIARACEIAKSVDKVILCIGTNGEWESEGYDRKNITLPLRTNDLVSAVLKANPNSVVVNQSGTPCEFPWINEAKAVVQAWFGGNELGNAIADVLYGDVNPSGKLSLTFPKKFEDNPAYLNYRTERGRVLYGEDIFIGYRYYEKLQKQVLFPFGYGLSYTTFKLSDLVVSVDESAGKISVSLKVKNTGSVDGKEVVQVYISKTESDVIRPVKELKDFEKVALKAGEEKTVTLQLELKDSVSYFDEWENKWHAQEGEYSVQVGASSDDIELIGTFDLKKGFYWLGL